MSGKGSRRRALWSVAVVAAVAAVLPVTAGTAAAATCMVNKAKSDDGSCITSVITVDSARRVFDLVINSTAGNRVTAQRARVMLPSGHGADPGRRWPTLYLLHGGGVSGSAGYRDWTENTDVAEVTAGYAALVVMPEAASAGWYSDWVNGSAYWETFHRVELRQLLERNYAASGRRAIAGLSMGGFGAMSYAARYPGEFAAVASYSGALHPLADFSFIQSLLFLNFQDINGLWGDPTTAAGRARWQEHDPYYSVDALFDIPVYVASGQPPRGSDPLNLETVTNRETLAFENRLNAAYVAAHPGSSGAPLLRTHHYEGTHDWQYWEAEFVASVDMLMDAVGG
ncbi:alpha/beta hydrolase [Actinokineospora iranica]|uniref:Acyl-CoA:diacylglycerol acyltransferase n=1 Tax=Actinokineospora iranica TaxID=1271860 RepID=A0A1G6IR54_9PSEU|nr:alpha/beta hydrolase family protein [Actinokineospora iranica]SDC09052.1 S-formylglutathione hydrolase FrmB [Actinokineospora iranica]